MTMMRIIFTLVPYLLVSCQAEPVCDANNKCSASVDDETSLMQNKIQLHQQSQEEPVPAAPAKKRIGRIIGATSAMTQKQTEQVAHLLKEGSFTVVDWDGDGLSPTSFTGALLAETAPGKNFLNTPGNLARPHYLPGTDAGWMVPTNKEHPAMGKKPGAAGAELTQVQLQAGHDHLNKVFGDSAWQTAMGTDWVYAGLAAADAIAFPPDVTFWLLSETRDLALLKNWVSLVEYRAFVQGACDGCNGKFVIIDVNGNQLMPQDLTQSGNEWMLHAATAPFAELGWNFGARIIGGTKGMTPAQVEKTSDLLAAYHRVDWDGDGITNPAAFTAAMTFWNAKKLRRSQAKGVCNAGVAFVKKECNTAVPHYLPGNPDNYYTPCVKCEEKACPAKCAPNPALVKGKKVFLKAGDVPEKDMTMLSGREISPQEVTAGSDHLSKVLKGDGWKKEFGSSAQYAELAAADVIAFPPKVTFWLLQDDRPASDYKNWVSLIEYKAFAKGQCAGCNGEYVIIDSKGEVLKGDDLTKWPFNKDDAKLAALGWGAAAGAKQAAAALPPPAAGAKPFVAPIGATQTLQRKARAPSPLERRL